MSGEWRAASGEGGADGDERGGGRNDKIVCDDDGDGDGDEDVMVAATVSEVAE